MYIIDVLHLLKHTWTFPETGCRSGSQQNSEDPKEDPEFHPM